MASTLVDSNILLDVFTEDAVWFDRSATALASVAENAELIINPLIYAEVSVRFATIEELEDALPSDVFRRESLPWEASFLAGKAFVAYRRRGGARHAPLPDFYIGAHAAVRGLALLTREPARYRTYFPKLNLLSPE